MASISGLGGTPDLALATHTASSDIASSRTAIAPPPAPNTQAVNTVPEMSKIADLKVKDPSQFQEVLTDAVTNLKAAAKQTADPLEASFLWSLADRFQLALDTGDTSPLQAADPGSSSSTSGPAAG